MAKKANEFTLTAEQLNSIVESRITEVNVVDVLDEGMSRYALSDSCRSLPNVKDGLKPSQRRVLYQLQLSHLDPNSKPMKINKIAGALAGLHPHGAGALEEVCTNLSQEWEKRVPLTQVHGNNGSVTGEPPAAPRYIKARQTKFTNKYILSDLKQSAKFIPSYDGEEIEPEFLPVRIPLALCNINNGIGTGTARVSISYNPIELMETAKQLVLTPTITNDEIIEQGLLQGPDLATGCSIINDEVFAKDLSTGSASYIVRAKIEKTTYNGLPALQITELPPGVTIDKLLSSTKKGKVIKPSQVAKIIDELLALGYSSAENNSSSKSSNLFFVFNKKTTEEQLDLAIGLLYNKTDLQTRVSTNGMYISDYKPTVFSVREALAEFITFRLETLRRLIESTLERNEKLLNVNKAVLTISDDIDEAIAIIKQSDSKADAIENLMARYDSFDEEAATYIANLQLHQLTKVNVSSFEESIKKIRAIVAECNHLLTNDDALINKLVEDFDEVIESLKKDKDMARRTVLQSTSDAKVYSKATAIAVTERKKVMVVVKSSLQVIQLGTLAYNNQIDSYSEDDIVFAQECYTTDYINIFTKDGRVVTRLVNDIPTATLAQSQKPMNLQLRNLQSSDKFIGASIIDSAKKSDYDNELVLLLSKNGYIKLTPSFDFLPNIDANRYKNTTAICSSLKSPNDELIHMQLVSSDELANLVLKGKTKLGNKTYKRTVNFDKYIGKTHGVGGSGFAGIYTDRGKHTLVDYEFITKSTHDNTEDSD